MNQKEIKTAVDSMRSFYQTGKTLSVEERILALKRLKSVIQKMESEIHAALREDLNKSETESYMCETGLTLSELSHAIKHVRKWAKTTNVITPLVHFPAMGHIVKEPYGVVLVMSPWNYPFMLTMCPVIGAIAAGNCVLVKPSAYSPATSAVIEKVIKSVFDENWVRVIQGGREENKALLDQKFDYIFFTGGVNVGKEVMKKASEHLTPVTLELGGKSPVIVDHTAKLSLAAKRLVFGKLLNCGQTCIAPDYILIEESVKDQFIEYVKKYIRKQYGKDVLSNPDYVHMINQKHYERVMNLIHTDKVVYGGKGDPYTHAIEPTILDNVSPEDPVMQEEIFGPIFPFITVSDRQEAIEFINSRPHPLALYLFSEDQKFQKQVMKSVPFGGGCINEAIMHIATNTLPFGGVGDSGMGSYHGKKSFDTFTHEKSVLKKANWLDIPARYAPYIKLQDKIIRMFLH